MKPDLSLLGLSKGQESVYLAVLKKGPSSATEIQRAAGLERRTIYDVLNKLVDKGLLSFTVSQGKQVYAVAPLSKVKEEIKFKQERLKEIVPSLESLYNSSKSSIGVEILRGKEGLKTIFEDLVDYNEAYFLGGGWYVVDMMPIFWSRINAKRKEKGALWHNLVQYEVRTKKIKGAADINVKYLPKEMSANPSVIILYGGKVINMVWADEFFAFVMENKSVAENYRKYFWYLWNNVGKENKKR